MLRKPLFFHAHYVGMQ